MEKINFEDLPSTNTPLDADTLNEMQDNIEKSVVAVGSTQPSTGENVWIKKGKNKLNTKLGFYPGYISSTGSLLNDMKNALFSYIQVEPDTMYTISTNTSISNIAVSFFDTSYSFISREQLSSSSVLTVTSPSNTKYMRVAINYDASSAMTQSIIDSLEIQVEQNSQATTYEPYVEKSIYTKNNQNVYEQFYTENKPVNYNIIATTTIDSNLTAYATGSFDFSMYSEIVVQLGSGSEGDSVLFKIPSNPNNSNLINSVAHLDMYASSSYRCRAFTSLYFNSTSTGIVRVNPKQLTGWSSVAVTIKGVLK